ncbi:MAG: heavy metal-associated domain-containing protein [Desulfocapsaceae bacterium]|nr:heavy metal-associated domain-containing protein [Desulfocapsaceae bacterium]
MAMVKIKGMTCQHCVASTKEALEQIPGVKDVIVDLEKGQATYSGDVDQEKIKDAITKIGFEVV